MARMAGFLYFIYIATSIVADLFGKIVNADPPTLIHHITSHETQFRIGFVISLFSVVFFLLAAWYLYVLLKPVNQDAALLFLLLNLSGFTIWCLSLFNLSASLSLMSGADYLKAFEPDQLQAQAMLFITLRRNAAVIAQIPYGIWLFPLGYLVYKSGFLPKTLGILLIADCFGLLIYVCQRFLLPGQDIITYPCLMLSLIAELSLSLWLVLKGIKNQSPTLADGQK